jgi:hypothetical protein
MNVVILDNSAVNYLVPIGQGDSSSRLYRALASIQQSGTAKVFATPTNAIEISLCPDADKRHQMAKSLNELIRGDQMLPSFEFAVLVDFCRIVEKQFPGGLKKWEPVERISRDNTVSFIALLGQMAALHDFQPRRLESIVLSKLRSKLGILRLLDEPQRFLRELASQADGGRASDEALLDLGSIDDMVWEDIEAGIEELANLVSRTNTPTNSFMIQS